MYVYRCKHTYYQGVNSNKHIKNDNKKSKHIFYKRQSHL